MCAQCQQAPSSLSVPSKQSPLGTEPHLVPTWLQELPDSAPKGKQMCPALSICQHSARCRAEPPLTRALPFLSGSAWGQKIRGSGGGKLPAHAAASPGNWAAAGASCVGGSKLAAEMGKAGATRDCWGSPRRTNFQSWRWEALGSCVGRQGLLPCLELGPRTLRESGFVQCG